MSVTVRLRGDSSLALGMTSAAGAARFFFAVAVLGESELALRGNGFARRLGLLRRWRRGHLHSNQFTDAALFHGHAVQNVRFRNRPLVVRNDDELALPNESIEHSNEAGDV